MNTRAEALSETTRRALRQRLRMRASVTDAFGTRSVRANVALTDSMMMMEMVEKDNNYDKLELKLGEMVMQKLQQVQQDGGEVMELCSMVLLVHGEQLELQQVLLAERVVQSSLQNRWQMVEGRMEACCSTMSSEEAVEDGGNGETVLSLRGLQKDLQELQQGVREARCEKACCSTLPPCLAMQPSPYADLLPSADLMLMCDVTGVFQHQTATQSCVRKSGMVPARSGCPVGRLMSPQMSALCLQIVESFVFSLSSSCPCGFMWA